MNGSPQFGSWQDMYNQLLREYSTLAYHYHEQTQSNLALYNQLENLLQEKISLLQTSSHEITTLPSIQLLPQAPDQHEEDPEPPRIKKIKRKSKKKHRRQSIRRKGVLYRCPYEGCSLAYHSSISMNLHIKIKHNGGTKKERQAYAIMLLDCEENGIPAPKSVINLPPNFLNEFKKNYCYVKKYNM